EPQPDHRPPPTRASRQARFRKPPDAPLLREGTHPPLRARRPPGSSRNDLQISAFRLSNGQCRGYGPYGAPPPQFRTVSPAGQRPLRLPSITPEYGSLASRLPSQQASDQRQRALNRSYANFLPISRIAYQLRAMEPVHVRCEPDRPHRLVFRAASRARYARDSDPGFGAEPLANTRRHLKRYRFAHRTALDERTRGHTQLMDLDLVRVCDHAASEHVARTRYGSQSSTQHTASTALRHRHSHSARAAGTEHQ